MRNICLKLMYDGSRYRGWQRLGDSDNTIQGKLETALSRILGETVEVSGSGRTDAGVHALGQVANFRCESPMSCDEIRDNLRKYLPEDIGVVDCTEVHPRFHARLSAREKTYCYRIWNSESPNVFKRRYLYRFSQSLDLQAMEKAAGYLLGEHDFSAFCGNPRMKKSTVRTIFRLDILQEGEEVRIVITGNGFLQNMVRILVGTLLEVGQGTRSAESIPELFGAKRSQAGFLAPPEGLHLWEVTY